MRTSSVGAGADKMASNEAIRSGSSNNSRSAVSPASRNGAKFLRDSMRNTLMHFVPHGQSQLQHRQNAHHQRHYERRRTVPYPVPHHFPISAFRSHVRPSPVVLSRRPLVGICPVLQNLPQRTAMFAQRPDWPLRTAGSRCADGR